MGLLNGAAVTGFRPGWQYDASFLISAVGLILPQGSIGVWQFLAMPARGFDLRRRTRLAAGFDRGFGRVILTRPGDLTITEIRGSQLFPTVRSIEENLSRKHRGADASRAHYLTE